MRVGCEGMGRRQTTKMTRGGWGRVRVVGQG